MLNITFKPAYLSSLMTAGANLELVYNDLAPHANDRMTAALELAKHAKETQRQLKFVAISAGTPGIKHLAEAGAGYVTFSLVHGHGGASWRPAAAAERRMSSTDL